MEGINFTIVLLKYKIKEKRQSLRWLCEKMRKDPKNKQWRGMIKIRIGHIVSLKNSIKILKEDWKYKD